MRERIKITVFCIYAVCFFSFVMLRLSYNYDKAVTVSNPVGDDFVIIVDAGHGGSDGGAVASDGTDEASLNLNISKKLNDCLCILGFNTYMTRTDENSIGENGSSIRSEKVSDIHKRMDIMNSFDNCLFISIHQNYFQGSSSWGSQVFYSGNNPQSGIIAKSIQSSVIELLQPNNKRRIKKSGSNIYLLKNAQKPAVLVECGFMSNAEELNNLKDVNYQQKLVLSIANGIIDYISEKDV